VLTVFPSERQARCLVEAQGLLSSNDTCVFDHGHQAVGLPWPILVCSSLLCRLEVQVSVGVGHKGAARIHKAPEMVSWAFAVRASLQG
jgi:hypothetical protein